MVQLAFLLGAKKDYWQLTMEERDIIAENQAQARRSARDLANDIYSGRYEGEVQANASLEGLKSRIGQWVTAALGMFDMGKLFRDDDPYLRWRRGDTQESCSDCKGYDGKARRASEWRALGVHPKGRMLACGGWKCQCEFEEVMG